MKSLSLPPTSAFQHGQFVMLCKTCLLCYGERIYHCGDCKVASGALHIVEHDSWVWVLQGSGPGDNKVYCNKCDVGNLPLILVL